MTFGKLTTIIAPHLVLIHFPPRRNSQTGKKKNKKGRKSKTQGTSSNVKGTKQQMKKS